MAATIYEDDVNELDVLSLISSLVDKSLLVADVGNQEPRFWLLESFRHYASEKLAASGEAALVANRHARAYLELAKRLQRNYGRMQRSDWVDQAKPELENGRTALVWTLQAGGDVVIGQRLAAALRRVWTHFAYTEGRRWVREALALVDERIPSNVAAELELIEASIACDLSELAIAHGAAERALKWRRQPSRRAARVWGEAAAG
jgi:predicted ATPase